MPEISNGTSQPPMNLDLSGKVAIITGATRGIGRAIALNLARRGCSILGTCTSEKSMAGIQTLREEINTIYHSSQTKAPRIVGLVLSLTDPEAARLVASAIQDNFDGQVDIFINNAAVQDRTHLGSLDPDHLSSILLANIQTPALIIDELVKRRYFRPQSRLVFISSAESTKCDPSVFLYATTKAANEAMARSYANAFGGRYPEFDFMAGTTSNSIMTGLTNTDGPKAFGQETWNELEKNWVAQQSIPRLAQAEDVAGVVGLLCGREAGWITGSKVGANGGSVAIL